ncbi:hypothetical protein ABPG72_000117 [Tetrahymena utriculariae]
MEEENNSQWLTQIILTTIAFEIFFQRAQLLKDNILDLEQMKNILKSFDQKFLQYISEQFDKPRQCFDILLSLSVQINIAEKKYPNFTIDGEQIFIILMTCVIFDSFYIPVIGFLFDLYDGNTERRTRLWDDYNNFIMFYCESVQIEMNYDIYFDIINKQQQYFPVKKNKYAKQITQLLDSFNFFGAKQLLVFKKFNIFQSLQMFFRLNDESQNDQQKIVSLKNIWNETSQNFEQSDINIFQSFLDFFLSVKISYGYIDDYQDDNKNTSTVE